MEKKRKRKARPTAPLRCVSHAAHLEGYDCLKQGCNYFTAAALVEGRLKTIAALAGEAVKFFDLEDGDQILDTGLTVKGAFDAIRALAESIPDCRLDAGRELDFDDERLHRPGALLLEWLGGLADPPKEPEQEEDPSPRLRVLRGEGTAQTAGPTAEGSQGRQ